MHLRLRYTGGLGHQVFKRPQAAYISQLQVRGSSVQVSLAQVSLNQRETLEETQGLLFRARGGRDRMGKREGGSTCQRYRV